jgi:hypothetical protein
MAASKTIERWMPAIVAVVTVAIPSYFTYKSSKAENASGYQVLVQSVQELQNAVEAQDKKLDAQSKELSELRGELKAWSAINRVRVARPAVVPGEAIPVPARLARPPRFMLLPENLSKAHQQVQKTAQ